MNEEKTAVDEIVKGVTEVVDKRLSEAFSMMDARFREHTNVNLAAHEEHRKDLDKLRRHMTSLWRYVRGSDPPPSNGPPPPDGDGTSIPPEKGIDDIAREAEAKASQTDLEMSALESRMIVGFADLQKNVTAMVEEKIKDHSKAIDTKVDNLHKKQDEQTAILVDIAKHPLFRQFVLAVIVAIITRLGFAIEVKDGLPVISTSPPAIGSVAK